MTDRGSSAAADRLMDEYLVVAARDGERRAFEHLARRWHPRLVAHAWRLTGDLEKARDAAQGGWIEIIRGLSRLRDERAFPAWAYRIVSRRCARAIGQAQRDRSLLKAFAAEPEIAAGETGLMDEAKLHAAIRALPPVQRAAVALFHFEEMSVAEVAVALDSPVGTIKTRLMHARRALRVVLEGEKDA